jgi:hypothetical protein
LHAQEDVLLDDLDLGHFLFLRFFFILELFGFVSLRVRIKATKTRNTKHEKRNTNVRETKKKLISWDQTVFFFTLKNAMYLSNYF